jgi:hypothetical protein
MDNFRGDPDQLLNKTSATLDAGASLQFYLKLPPAHALRRSVEKYSPPLTEPVMTVIMLPLDGMGIDYLDPPAAFPRIIIEDIAPPL